MSRNEEQAIPLSEATVMARVPMCVQRRGTPCNDCAECLSALPAGLTCDTGCRHVSRCKALFGQKGTEAFCQWVPSRFAPVDP